MMPAEKLNKLRFQLENLMRQRQELLLRATGKTTRLVDEYIQKLYKEQGQWVKIKDHHCTAQADRMLFNKILDRMAHEHPSDEVRTKRNTLYPQIMLVRCVNDNIQEDIDELTNEIDTLNAEVKELDKKLKEMYG